jgi:nickel/cobalt transporter (NicO) family protein
MRAVTRNIIHATTTRAFAAAALVLALAGPALAAKSPFGIGTPDSSGSAFDGPLGGLFAWVALYQAQFYRALTGAFAEMKHDGRAFYLLAGISFLYGVFHAVGPGHGKAVITSYLLVSRQTVQRGILVSFISAMVQGAVAIAVVLVATFVLHATAIGMTRTTNWLEIVSYALIAAVGAWLLWVKATGRGHPHRHHSHDHRHHSHEVGKHSQSAHAHSACHSHAGDDHAHDHQKSHSEHSHAPDPRLLAKPLTLSHAWSAILAVGIRPCSGALIVLVFALSQNLLLAGVGAVLAMSLGTFITVAVLAILAVAAKDVALRFVGVESQTGVLLVRVVEIGGALAVLLLGLVLLGGALQGGFPT